MKILHLTGYFNEKVAYQENMLTLGQHELGHEVYVLTSNLLIEIPNNVNSRIVPTGFYSYEGIKIIRTSYWFEVKKNALVYYESVFKNLFKIKPDYIFIHDKGFYIFPVLFYKLFFKRNLILRMDFHSDFTNSMNSRFGKFYHFFFKVLFKLFGFAFDKYYYIAPEMGDFVRKIYDLPIKKCELLRLPGNNNHVIDKTKQKLRDIWNLDKNKIYFLHSGKMPEGKKTIELIKSIKSLEVTLIICGSITGKNSEKLKKLISETPNVKFIGWVNPDELRELIKACDALVQPGTLSNTFVEAVCIGTPLVLADSPQARDLIFAKNGIIIEEPINSFKLRKSLLKFIKNIDAFKNFAKKPVDVFNYKTISKQSLEI